MATDSPSEMDVADAVAAFERLGLTSYEARVFIALQRLGSGTARDVHRVADVPRSQVYSAAESLEERGLVEVQQSSPMRYRPVSIEEARQTLTERFEREQDRAFDFVQDVRREADDADEEQEDIWTIRGREQVADRTAGLVREAEDWVLFGVGQTDLVTDDIRAALAEQAAAGVVVGVVTDDADVAALFADVDGVSVRSPDHPHDEEKSGRVVFADDDILLLSVLGQEEIPGINRETAFWSAHTNFASALISLIQTREDGFER
jgi:sugar-specific transcriptional regulator TrmB